MCVCACVHVCESVLDIIGYETEYLFRCDAGVSFHLNLDNLLDRCLWLATCLILVCYSDSASGHLHHGLPGVPDVRAL